MVIAAIADGDQVDAPAAPQREFPQAGVAALVNMRAMASVIRSVGKWSAGLISLFTSCSPSATISHQVRFCQICQAAR